MGSEQPPVLSSTCTVIDVNKLQQNTRDRAAYHLGGFITVSCLGTGTGHDKDAAAVGRSVGPPVDIPIFFSVIFFTFRFARTRANITRIYRSTHTHICTCTNHKRVCVCD